MRRAATNAIILTILSLASAGPASAESWSTFVEDAGGQGELAARAAAFLAEYRPESDRDLDVALLNENLAYALRARATFPWAAAVPEPLFLNDVLPYAVLDETRERWRPEFFAIASDIVQSCSTATEAAQALNREFFTRINVHYDTGRKAPNQSPSESIAQGRATCTGLSIILVDACRAVGVPARVAGVASWTGKEGNHTWVEIWDGGWFFLGADEYDAKGLDRAWFVGDARRAIAGDPLRAVRATSWRRTDDGRFPMAWNLASDDVPGVDVTRRYVTTTTPATIGAAIRHLRAWDRPGGTRLPLRVTVRDDAGAVVTEVDTRDGAADLNDMPAVTLAPGHRYTVSVQRGDEVRRTTFDIASADERTEELHWNRLALDEATAERLVAERQQARAEAIRAERAAALDAGTVAVGDQSLAILERTFGDAPEGGRSLWISMHGGGGAPTAVNDQQWRNQIRLYEPAEGLYVAPRAPTDTWNLWHQAPIDDLFDALIETCVAARDVNPDRVYLLGYSAGGDGVYQLAPRMADRFAAAAMMAGHPNESAPDGLRNLPFAIFVGGKDGAYRRNEIAVEWAHRLDELHAADPDGYPHRLTVYPECGHWMNGQDREALPWMAEQTRDAWPRRVVWRQDDVTHTRFYWLAIDAREARAGRRIEASVDGQTIRIVTDDVRAVTLRLRDRLVDLDRPLTVEANGTVVFEGIVPRTEAAIEASLAERADPRSAATARLDVSW